METKVERSDFDTTTAEITKSLQELLEKLLGQVEKSVLDDTELAETKLPDTNMCIDF